LVPFLPRDELAIAGVGVACANAVAMASARERSDVSFNVDVIECEGESIHSHGHRGEQAAQQPSFTPSLLQKGPSGWMNKVDEWYEEEGSFLPEPT
jgi:hypothetical protein